MLRVPMCKLISYMQINVVCAKRLNVSKRYVQIESTWSKWQLLLLLVLLLVLLKARWGGRQTSLFHPFVQSFLWCLPFQLPLQSLQFCDNVVDFRSVLVLFNSVNSTLQFRGQHVQSKEQTFVDDFEKD